MASRKLHMQVEVELTCGADARAVERLALEVGRRVSQDVIREAMKQEEEPSGCPSCGKRGRSRTVR